MENQYIVALLNTILVPIIIMIIGSVVEFISDAQVRIMMRYIGRTPALFIRNRLTFVGTIHHELSHALFATLTGAKVTKIELLKFNGEALGCVKFRTRGGSILQSIQLTMTAIAPIVCGCGTVYGLYVIMGIWCVSTWQYVVVIILMISIIYHMDMSSQDISGALRGLPTCMILLYIFFFFTKINFIPLG